MKTEFRIATKLDSNHLMGRSFVFAFGLLLTDPAQSAPVPIPNASFETPSLNGNASGQQMQNMYPASPTGWTFAYEQLAPTSLQNWGVLDPPNSFYGVAHPLPAPFEGNQVGYINLNYTGTVARADSAIVGTLESNRVYTLSVAVGARNNNQWPNIAYSTGLVDENGTELGTFATVTLDPGSPAAYNITDLHYFLEVNSQASNSIGRGYFVRIRAANTGVSGDGTRFPQANFDHVRLDVNTNQSASLLLNGDFELGTLQGWQNVYNPGNQPVQWSLTSDPGNVRAGAHAGALTAFGGTNSLLIISSSSVDVSSWPTGSLCLGTLHVKTRDLQLANPRTSLKTVMLFWDASYQNVLGYCGPYGDFHGTHDYLPVHILGTVPPGAAWVQLQIYLDSGIAGGAAYVDDMEVQRVFNPGDLSTNIPDCRVLRDARGTPRLYINGVAQNPSFFFGHIGHPVIYDEIKLAAGAGVNLIQMELNLPWFGTSDAMMELALEANSNALFLPRISLFQPGWYRATHAGEEFVDQNGDEVSAVSGASLASDTFIQVCKDQLETTIRYLHNTPYASRIIGYHLDYLNTAEWFYPDIANRFWDYSEVNQQKFVAWLQTRYATVSDLNTAWHKSYPSFADVRIPSTNDWMSSDDGVFRDPSKQRAVPDYAEYHNNLVADRIAELAAFVKSLTGGRSLMIAFYGYLNELINNGAAQGIAHSGHLGIKRLLASPDIDMLCSPVSYYQRDVGFPANMHSPVDAVEVAGKLYLQEDDSNTYVVTPSDSIPWYPTEWDTMQCFRRNYGNVIGHNQATWWMDLYGDGRFNAPAIWTNNALLVRTYDDVIAHQSPAAPQIAVLFDEETFFWLKADARAVTFPSAFTIRSVFQECGAAVGYYLVEDLPSLPDSVKLVVFANTFRLDDAEQMMISQAKTNGRTFLWLYAPGYVSETNLSLNGMQQATGFTFIRNPASTSVQLKVTSTNSPITRDLPNHQFGSANLVAPNFYVDASVGSPEVLGRYLNNNQPGFVVKDYGSWKSIFSGGLNLTVPMLRSIARYAGVNLLAEGDTLDATNAVNYMAPYLYVYAMHNAGRRCFQLPGEKVPNGNFEKFTGAFPTSGFGRWISPSSGSLPACQVVNTNAAVGSNACATGPFNSNAGQYSEPLGIELQGETGRTYQVSCSVFVDGLDASAASPGDFISLVVRSHNATSNLWTGVIADGAQGPPADKSWTQLSGSFTFTGSAAGPYQNTFDVLLKVNGRYSAQNLLVDNVSVREDGCEPVDVTEIVSNRPLGQNVTSWADDFALNEQKIFRLTPMRPPAFLISEARLLDSGKLRIQWSPAGSSYRYTVEESDALPGGWLTSDATNSWPIMGTEIEILPTGTPKFFRIKAQPAN
jgi:hapalindole biogenesis HpiC1 cyclase-like protein/glycosyl hydrolase family 42 (putative beta-galactosidase)